MHAFLRDNAGLCVSAAALVAAASRIFAFAGYDPDTAVLVVREAGAISVGLTALIQLLPSLFCTGLLYGAVFLTRRPSLRTSRAVLLASGLVAGYCVFAAPWTVLLFYIVVTVVMAFPTREEPSSSADAGRLDRFNAFMRTRIALPAVGFAAAGLLVGGGAGILPSERVTTEHDGPIVGYVLRAAADDAVLLRESDRKVLRVGPLVERQPCRTGQDPVLDAPPLRSIGDDRADYPPCLR
jgi:hypothetical protein